LPTLRSFTPRLDILPAAQRALWTALAPAKRFGLVLYGGTAIALRLGHRQSIDFDFFASAELEKEQLRDQLPFLRAAHILQEERGTLVVSTAGDPVKVSFFWGMSLGRVGEPQETDDGALRVAALIDLTATKLKSILDRAEAKDYLDLAALLRAGVPLEDGIAAFVALFGGEPATVLRALGYFGDGDLAALSEADRLVLRAARDRVGPLPAIPPKAPMLDQ
jgi:hypothetical protein